MNQPKTIICPTCQTGIAPGLLVCPSCQSLVYKNELKDWSANAERFREEGKPGEALKLWRQVLEHLPQDTRQYIQVQQKINELAKVVDHSPVGEHKSPKLPAFLTGLGAVGIILWKFKFIAILILTKAKLLFLGLTKAQTFFSMLLSFGVYWSIWGWKFALGIVLSIYVHEMGHVFALKKFGIPTTLPIFIPGVGAFIRLKQGSISPLEDARIGLAGPIAGLGAAVFCYVIYLSTGSMIWGAIARTGAWINLFNLLPIVPLDGGRGFHVLTRNEKWIACGVLGSMLLLTGEGLLVLVLLAALYNAFAVKPQLKPDRIALLEYCGLVIALSLLAKIHVPVGAG